MIFHSSSFPVKLLHAFLILPLFFACSDALGGDEGDDDDEPGISVPAVTSDGNDPWLDMPEALTVPGRMQNALNIAVKSNVLHAEVRPARSEQTEENDWAPEDLIWKHEYGNEAYIGIYLDENNGDEPRSADYEVWVTTYPTANGTKDSLLGTFTLTQSCANGIVPTDTLATQSSITLNCKVRGDLIGIKYLASEHENADPMGLLRFEGQTMKVEGPTAAITWDGLKHSSTYWLYAVGIGADSLIDEATFIEQELATPFPEGDDLSLIFRVSANPANEYTVHLPMATYYEDTNEYQIDWGEGILQPRGDYTHTYTNSGKADYYRVKIKGHLSTIDTDALPSESYTNTIIAVEQWGNTRLTRLQMGGLTSLESIVPDTQGAFELMESMGACDKYSIGAFEDCTGLKEIPEGLFDYAVNVKDFNRTFLGCTGLTSIPENLFAKATKAESFALTFYLCENLTEIPGKLFARNINATGFASTFGHCAKLTAIPQQLFQNNTKAANFSGTFQSCTSLAEIPEMLLKGCPDASVFGENFYTTEIDHPDLNYISGMFMKCTSLTALPADLLSYCPRALDISGMFSGCKALTSVPEGFLAGNPQIKYCISTFEYCDALKSVPVSLFDNCTRITYCRRMFNDCTSLEGESPYLMQDGKKVHLYDRASYPLVFPAMVDETSCFGRCSKLTDYADMPGAWK